MIIFELTKLNFAQVGQLQKNISLVVWANSEDAMILVKDSGKCSGP